MRIDYDCVRAVLAAVSDRLSTAGSCNLHDVKESLTDYDELTIYFATLALRDKGYICGVFDHSDGHEMHICEYTYITPSGYEFLDSVRSDKQM